MCTIQKVLVVANCSKWDVNLLPTVSKLGHEFNCKYSVRFGIGNLSRSCHIQWDNELSHLISLLHKTPISCIIFTANKKLILLLSRGLTVSV